MVTISLISIIASFIIFGGISVFTLFFASKEFWTTFKAGDLLGLEPNWADSLFAHGTALAVRSFPWIIFLALVAAVFLYVSDRHLLAAIVAWLPLINFLIPALLFVNKIIASR